MSSVFPAFPLSLSSPMFSLVLCLLPTSCFILLPFVSCVLCLALLPPLVHSVDHPHHKFPQQSLCGPLDFVVLILGL